MVNREAGVGSLSGVALLAATRDLVRKAHVLEGELLVHLGEVDERKLYLDCSCSSMFEFCVKELGFSEAVAYDRIMVARAGRRLPAILDAATAGRVHLTGLRLLVPHLTEKNQAKVLAEAAGKSKREIEEIVARLAPREPVPTLIRRIPGRRVVHVSAYTRMAPGQAPASESGRASDDQRMEQQGIEQPRPLFVPLSVELFKVQFTATRGFRDRFREAQGLLRHRVPDGDMETIIGQALDLLIEQVKKERFGVGRKARNVETKAGEPTASRHIPDAIKRAVYERDEGSCTFTDDRGRRCGSTDGLVFDHVDGFARTHVHSVENIRLLCRAHNQYAAERMYGRGFMEEARARGKGRRAQVDGGSTPVAGGPARTGTSPGPAPPCEAGAGQPLSAPDIPAT